MGVVGVDYRGRSLTDSLDGSGGHVDDYRGRGYGWCVARLCVDWVDGRRAKDVCKQAEQLNRLVSQLAAAPKTQNGRPSSCVGNGLLTEDSRQSKPARARWR